MTNVLEDMKAVYEDKVWEFLAVKDYGECRDEELKEGQVLPEGIVFDLLRLDMIETLKSVKDIPASQVKPLLKFPDKGIWSGDLLKTMGGNYIFIWFDDYSWFFRDIWSTDGEFEIDNGAAMLDKAEFQHLQNNYNPVRVCHAYDKEALDHLPEDVVNKLKGEVK